MRIIIELDSMEKAKVIDSDSTEFEPIEILNGGEPPTALIHGITGDLPENFDEDVIDAGSPQLTQAQIELSAE